MSNRELAKALIDNIPEERLIYVIPFLQGASIPNEAPNAETLASMDELDNGGGFSFSGTTKELFAELGV